ncbi:MAG: hypothetical protein KDB90_06825 [Planctomycetes bacterium]|nr:hypothetical protein [Planctomycetota bacterium]
MFESFLSILETAVGLFLSLMLTFGIAIGAIIGGILFLMLPVVLFAPPHPKTPPTH